MKKNYLITCLVLTMTSGVLAQSVKYAVELGGGVPTESPAHQQPFWLRANQYGTVPLTGTFGTLRLGISRDYAPRSDTVAANRKKMDWGFGLYAVGNTRPNVASYPSRVLLPDAFVKVRYRWLELFGGNRREVYGQGDTLLTSGFVSWSGNAPVFPKIQLHTPDYVPLGGFLKKAVAFRAGYAHGWLANTYIQGSYLHQKYVAVRFGKPQAKIKAIFGLNHQVQWGGRADYLVGTDLSVDGNLPTAFRDYLSLVTGRYPDDLQNSRYTVYDGTNRIGNHVGHYDLAVEWQRPGSYWSLYHQHYFEDASGLALINAPDGLTGLRFRNDQIRPVWFRLNRAVLEWLSTMSQSGSIFDINARYQGADNYFNNSQYREGWSYRGYGIGTPLAMPRLGLSDTVNTINSGGYFLDNRIKMGHVAFIGTFRHGPTVTLRATYSQHYGTYTRQFDSPFGQFSGLLSAQWQLSKRPGTTLTTSFAVDRGSFIQPATGSFISLKKVW
ncbi:MAG: hypothetical protein H7319_02390 [Spirosoma sp.]|nr:hypothetical protein [Spirosoma sp.]